MKRKTLVLTAAALFAAVVACYAAGDAFMGTWKLNEAKSTIGAGMPKNSMVVFAAAGESVKVTVVGTNGDGTSLHTEWTGKFDGKYYPATGDPTADSRSYELVNDHTLTITSKQGDKVTFTLTSTVSADGKTRTSTGTGTDAKGMKTPVTYVFDKQ